MYKHTIDVHNTKAAEVIVPLLLQYIKPKSVVDVGCGIGTWLKVFEKYIGEDYLGIDGDYVNRALLMIPKEKFLAYDLRTPLTISRKFDLVVSLEVAEHLPETSADIFINSLSNLGDNILFSAAIPGQGGQNHLNEQWPEYWIKKFEKYGFKCLDLLRPLVWNNPNVDLWYKQNILFFTTDSTKFAHLTFNKSDNFSVVHPEMFELVSNRYKNFIEGRVGFRLLVSVIIKSVKRKIHNLFYA